MQPVSFRRHRFSPDVIRLAVWPYCRFTLGFLDVEELLAQRSIEVSYENESLGRVEVVDDFLPPPEKLLLRDDGVKVTISLSKRSVEFFKAHAAASKVPYQPMIRALLDGYVDKYEDRPAKMRSSGRRSRTA